ncbi:MAG: class I SAM-dependent methyltransferase [Rhodocyclaceae bacterium]
MSIHRLTGEPSPWVVRFEPLFSRGAEVLDLACGGGRHALWLAARGHRVTAVDRDAAALRSLSGIDGVRTQQADLEQADWPLTGRRFDAVVVTNYLFRPHLASLWACVAPGGMLIYETFMCGNERFGKPSNPDFLLQPGELLDWLDKRATVVAFEQGEIAWPKPAAVQRVCAVNAERYCGRLPI